MIQYISVCLDNITCTLTQLATRVSQLLMDGHWRWSSLLPQGLASPRYNNTVEQQRQLIQEETQQGNIPRYCFHGDHAFVESDEEVFCAISN